MEHEEFASDNLDPSPRVSQGFQADKFLKMNNHLNIPDTISEHSSEEINGESIKIEDAELSKTPVILKGGFVSDDKENMNCSQLSISVKGDESSSCSTIVPVDNSYIINCERRLLESSSDEEKNKSWNKSVESEFFNEIPKKLGLPNDTISTPPSALRKQISLLRNEMADAYEFHDLELKVLKEECLDGRDPQNNLQWIEKYAVLMELYTSLKNEYDEYRKEQEKLQYKTADCLENLCSQIEASDSSLNMSGASFVSFNTEIKSSTMLENISEVEATVLHDGTVLASDPLSITFDGLFKTPLQTPLTSAKKLFSHELNKVKETPRVKEVKNVKELIANQENVIPVNTEYNIKLLDVETTLYEKMREAEDLEQRLFKVEDLSAMLQTEHERIESVLVKENKALREKVSKKSEQLEELTQKLFTEIISLKPSLRDSLTDAPGRKLLTVFIETIMESCKSIQDELLMKHSSEKAQWETQKKVEMTTIENLENQVKSLIEKLQNQESKHGDFEELRKMYEDLKVKTSEMENLILTRDEEVRLLQSYDSNIRRTRDDLATANETIMKLESLLSVAESEKKEIEDRCLKLEEMTTNLKNDIDLKETLLRDLEKTKCGFDNVQGDNENLKELIQESERVIADLKNELNVAKSEKEEILQEMENERNNENSKMDNLFEVLDESKKELMDMLSKEVSCLDEEDPFVEGSSNTKFSLLCKKSIFECCKSLKEKLNEQFNNEKAELESIKNANLTLIENLQNTIKTFSENNNENCEKTAKLSEITQERDDLKKLCNKLKEELSEAETVISSRDDEILTLKDYENNLKQIKGDLALAEEAVLKLKSQLLNAEAEKIEIEQRYSELEKANANLQTVVDTKETILRDLENFKFLYEKVQKECENARQQNKEMQLINSNLKTQLELARENQSACESRIEELLKEIESLKDKENSNILCLLKGLEESEKGMENLFSNGFNNFEVPADNVSKLITGILESNPSLNEENAIKVMSLFMETVLRSCKKLHKDFSEKYENEKNIWESQKNKDFLLIESLQNQIETLNEEKDLHTEMLSELAEMKELYNRLQEKLSEAEKAISFRDQQIQSQEADLKTLNEQKDFYNAKLAKLTEIEDLYKKLQEKLTDAEKTISSLNQEIQLQVADLKQTSEHLAAAEETVSQLKSQLTRSESEKLELEDRCQKLEEMTTNLKNEIDLKETLLQDLEKSKSRFDDAQSFKESIQQSERMIADLKDKLNGVKNEKEKLLLEMENHRNHENYQMDNLFEVLAESKKVLLDMLSKEVSCFDTEDPFMDENVEDSSNATFSLLCKKSIFECCKSLKDKLNEQFSSEKAELESIRKAHLGLIENLQITIKNYSECNNENTAKLSEIIQEREDLKKLCDTLKEELSKAQTMISSRDDEILTLKDQENIIKQIKGDLSSAEEIVMKLKEELINAETEKIEIEQRYSELEKANANLQTAIDTKDIILKDLENFKCLYEKVQAEFDNARQENEEIRLINSELKTELEEMKESRLVSESRIEDLLKEIESMKTAIVNKETILKDLENLKCLYEKVQTEYGIARKENEELQLTNSELKLELEAIEENRSSSESKIEELQREMDTLQTVIDTKEATLKDLESVKCLYEKVQTEYDIARKENEELQLTNSELKLELEAIKENQSSTETKIEELLKEIETLQIVINTKETILRDLENVKSLYENVRIEIDNARQENEELQLTNSELKTELEAFKEKQSTSESKIKELLKEIETMQGLIDTKDTMLKDTENVRCLYEKIQTERDSTRQQNEDLQLINSELKTRLETAKESQLISESKIEELLKEIEAVKDKKSNDLLCLLKALEESEKELQNIFSVGLKRFEMPDANVSKLITGVLESNPSLKEEKEIRVVSLFTETVVKSCKKLQIEFSEQYENEKNTWESKKNNDFQVIENLQSQIKALNEEKDFYNSKLAELTEMKELYNKLQEKLSEAENAISSRDRQIQSQGADLKQTAERLAAADETVSKLKSQLTSCEAEKTGLANRCQELEAGNLDLKGEINVLKNMDQPNSSERLTSENHKESNMKDLLKEIELLKEENEGLMGHWQKLQSAEEEKKNLTEILSDIQFCLDMPSDTLTKLLSGGVENKKVFSERINTLVKTQMEELRLENINLKFGNENLKEKLKELSRMSEVTSVPGVKNKSGKNADLCVRRLDKLEEMNHNLTELLMRILTMTEYQDLEKLKLGSVRDFPNVMKKVVAHINDIESKMNELKAENAKLDEECDSYAKTIKDLKKEAVSVWKSNKEKKEAMEGEISRLKEEKKTLENEKQELLSKISKLDSECQKLKSGSKTEGSLHACSCGNELKKINDLKRKILMKEQKILELQDLENQTAVYKSQIEYLENALEREKKKSSEEKQKNTKLQHEMNELTKNQKSEDKKTDENQMLDELRMRGSISGGIVQEFVDKEKMKKLSKDIGILKELCRARYAEIKRLEVENAALKNSIPKNSNQMDSPLRTRSYNTRSKNPVKDLWKTEIIGKENSAI